MWPLEHRINSTPLTSLAVRHATCKLSMLSTTSVATAGGGGSGLTSGVVLVAARACPWLNRGASSPWNLSLCSFSKASNSLAWEELVHSSTWSGRTTKSVPFLSRTLNCSLSGLCRISWPSMPASSFQRRGETKVVLPKIDGETPAARDLVFGDCKVFLDNILEVHWFMSRQVQKHVFDFQSRTTCLRACGERHPGCCAALPLEISPCVEVYVLCTIYAF